MLGAPNQCRLCFHGLEVVQRCSEYNHAESCLHWPMGYVFSKWEITGRHPFASNAYIPIYSSSWPGKVRLLALDTVSEHSKLPSYIFDHIRTTVRPCNSLVDRSKLTATRSSLEMCWANMEDRWRQLPPQYTACKQHQSSAPRYAITLHTCMSLAELEVKHPTQLLLLQRLLLVDSLL